MSKKRAMTSEQARRVRQRGHDDALQFALAIGLPRDYNNDRKAKKDVIDPAGDAHSVKSGVKRWQIFLYNKSRFEKDYAFQSMNGIGQLLIRCIDVFPEKFANYSKNKQRYKEKLRKIMRILCNKFQEKRRVRTFLAKSIFNGDEVNYLTIKNDNKFHVFLNKNVIDILSENLIVSNSKARHIYETPELKVLFKYKEKNVGELEVRNSGENHYREILFVMNKKKVIELLMEKVKNIKNYNEKVIMYDDSIRKFGHW
jgi:hypothetical protein